MVELTKLNGDKFFFNAEYILYIESIPDTILVTRDGKKIRVKDSAKDVVDKILEYKKKINKTVMVEYRHLTE